MRGGIRTHEHNAIQILQTCALPLDNAHILNRLGKGLIITRLLLRESWIRTNILIFQGLRLNHLTIFLYFAVQVFKLYIKPIFIRYSFYIFFLTWKIITNTPFFNCVITNTIFLSNLDKWYCSNHLF